MDNDYKIRKEAFVSGLNGGSIFEIVYVTGIALTSYALWAGIQSKYQFSNTYSIKVFIFEFIITILPPILSLTILHKYSLFMNIAFFTLAMIFHSSSSKFHKPQLNWINKNFSDQDEEGTLMDIITPEYTPISNSIRKNSQKNIKNSDKKPFLSAYRATMMILTCIAILAVDFPVFPRRFAKAETWGSSIMDLGVGSFVFSSGIVSARSFIGNSISKNNQFTGTYFISSIKQSFPLLFLGFIRVLMTKSVDYPEHITEYGIHWNFFFTLGFLPPFVNLISFSKFTRFTTSGLIIAIVYQISLSYQLQNWVLSAPRTNLFSSNKEGITSFFGYLSIFLIGLDAGHYILPLNPYNSLKLKGKKNSLKSSRKKRDKLCLILFSYSIIWISFYFLSSQLFNIKVSRQLANLSYILLVTSYNTFFLFFYLLIEIYFFPNDIQTIPTFVPHLFNSINTNGLMVFLIANLLTGIINLLIQTLDTSDFPAVFIIISYMIIVCSIAWILRNFRLKI